MVLRALSRYCKHHQYGQKEFLACLRTLERVEVYLPIFENMSMEEQFARDDTAWRAMLNPEGKSAEDKIRIDIMLRIFSLITDSNDKISVFSKLSHGGRVLIEIPPTTEHHRHDLWHFVTAGTTVSNHDSMHNDNVSKNKKSGAVITSRVAASHAVDVSADGCKEIKLYKNSSKDLRRMVQPNAHWGMNLALGYGEKNYAGKPIESNGSNGHLYLNYQAPTENLPGALLIGVEGSEPGKTSAYGFKHDFRALSAPVSPTGGMKWSNPKLQAQYREAFATEPPAKIGAFKVNCTPERMELIRRVVHTLELDSSAIQLKES